MSAGGGSGVRGMDRPRERRRAGVWWIVPCTTVALALAMDLSSTGRAMHAARLLVDALAFVCGACAVFGIGYTLVAGWLVRRFFACAPAEPSGSPGVTIVQPLHGDEWNLAGNLASFFEQDYAGPVQHLFGVHDPDDAALRTVDALRARYPAACITVVADARLYGPNRKIANLVNMLPHASHDVLCFADSDVSVGPRYLRHVVGALQQPDVGLVTCLYRGRCAPGWWPRFAAASTNYHFLPGVLTGLAIGRARPCFGQTIAMRSAMLERVGGLAQFAHHLAEDHALGEAVRRAGATVAIPPFAVRHACAETGLEQLVAHELRWSRTIRACDRPGHLGSALMHPLPFALLTAALAGGAPWAWALVALALLARLGLKWVADRAVREGLRGGWLLPLWDLLAFAIFVGSFCSSRVVWRGLSFEVDGNGLLAPRQND